MKAALRGYQPNYTIKYLLAVRDVSPLDRSVFQGFTPDIFPYLPVIEALVHLPPTAYDPFLSRPIRLARHAAGYASWLGTPASIGSLLKITADQLLEHPFMV